MNSVKNCVITIDGPAGSGKSTVARLLANKLKYSFLDTGAMYRAVAFAVMKSGGNFNSPAAIGNVLKKNKFSFRDTGELLAASINGIDITEYIRQPDVTKNASKIAALEFVRSELVGLQRKFAEQAGFVVTEGRDQGTVVFPDAAVKFFLTADVSERALRRHKELMEKGIDVSLQAIKQDIEIRDKSDMSRAIAPLRKAPNAVEIDTTNLDAEGVIDEMLQVLRTKTEIEI